MTPEIRTPKETIESAIIEGESYQDFHVRYPDVKYRRWKDLTYFLRKDGKIPPARSQMKFEQLLDDNRLKEVIEDERDRSELKHAKVTINRLKEALVTMHDTLDAIREGFKDLPSLSLPLPKKPEPSNKPRASLILPLYDLHIGHVTNGPLGRYGPDTFVSRCTALSEDLLREIDSLKRTRTIEKVVVIFGGDLIEGRTIYQGQSKESTPLQYQLVVGPEVLARVLLYPLAREVPAIDVLCLPGNHGRVGEKNEFDKTFDNLDMIFCHILRLRCEKIKTMTWHDLDSWFGCFSLYGFSYLAVHGDGFKSWGGTPLHGASKYKDKLQDVMDQRFDVMLAGHHHTPADWSRGASRTCMMNNWAGTSDYASSLGLGGPPSQKVLLADETNPILAIYEFMLARSEPQVKIDPIEIV